jgi:hypothetical protein
LEPIISIHQFEQVFRLLESLITRRSSRSLEYKVKQPHHKERLSIDRLFLMLNPTCSSLPIRAQCWLAITFGPAIGKKSEMRNKEWLWKI